MRIKVEKVGETAIIKDCKIITKYESLHDELYEIIEAVKTRDSAGLSLMDMVLGDIEETGLYEVTEKEGFDVDKNIWH